MNKAKKTHTERSNETKEKLVQAAIYCIEDKGIQNASLSMIVSKAGVSRGAQVHHFPLKINLYGAVMSFIIDKFMDEMKEIVDGESEPSKKIPLLIKYFWEIIFESPFMLCWMELVVAARKDEDLHKLLQPIDSRMMHLVHSMVRDTAMEVGHPDPDSVVIIANILSDAMRGMAMQKFFNPDYFLGKRGRDMIMKIADTMILPNNQYHS